MGPVAVRHKTNHSELGEYLYVLSDPKKDKTYSSAISLLPTRGVSNLGFRVQGLGFGVWGSGFGVSSVPRRHPPYK